MSAINLRANPGFLFEIQTGQDPLEEMLGNAPYQASAQNKGRLHLYVTGGVSEHTPTDNPRFSRVYKDADVIVFAKKNVPPSIHLNQCPQGHGEVLEEKLKDVIGRNDKIDKQKLLNPELLEKVPQEKRVALLFMLGLGLAIEDSLQSAGKYFKSHDPQDLIQKMAEEDNKNVQYLLSKEQKAKDSNPSELPLDTALAVAELLDPKTQALPHLFSLSAQQTEAADRGDWQTYSEINRTGDAFVSKLPADLVGRLRKISHESDSLSVEMEVVKKAHQFVNSGKNHLIVLHSQPRQELMEALGKALYASISIKGPFLEPKGCFWKVRGPDGKKGYLLGSIHATPDYMLDLNGKMRRSFLKSKTLAVETDVTRDEVREASLKSQEKEIKGKVDTLAPEEQEIAYSRALSLLYHLKIEHDPSLDKRHIIALALAHIASRINPVRALGYSSGIDFELLSQAKERGLGIEDLEDWKLHVGTGKNLHTDLALQLLSDGENDMLDSEYGKMFLQGLADQIADMYREPFEQMIKQWDEGDVEALSQKAREKDSSAERRKFIKRNQVMAERIAELIEAGRTPFCVAGAAHMGGKMSIPNYLEEYGFTVSRSYV